MNENPKKSSSLLTWNNLIGTISLAIAAPWIMFKVLQGIYLSKSFLTFAGKVVVITGASSGLGEALAHEFYKRGCQVVLCARRRQELERVRTDLLQMHPTVPTHPPIIIPMDVSDINSIQDQVNKILAITGHIDILINNAGISQRGLVTETKIDVDIRLMNVNYFGAVAVTKAVLPGMIQRKQGQIVMISSVQGLIAIPERSAYSASKHALQAFSDSLRAEVAQNNIEVLVVSAGYIRTSLSLNALTGAGDIYGQMDSTTQNGYSPDFVAQQIVRDVAQKKKESVISPIVPKVAVMLRKFFPGVYFYVMSKRARKAVQSVS